MLTYIGKDNNEYVFNALNVAITQKLSSDYILTFDVLNEPNISEETLIRCENQLFRIKQIDENMLGSQIRTSCNCKHISHDLIDYYEYEALTNTLTINKALDFVFNGTPFTYSIVGSVKNQSFENLGKMNKQSLLSKVIEKYGLEYSVDNYHFTFKPQIGSDTEFQFRYQANISDTKKSIDTTNLTTFIKAIGKCDENGNPLLSIEYTSPNASVYGIRHATPISDERFTVESELIEYAKSKLNDEPIISVTLKYQDLNTTEHINIGDYGYLIHEPLGLDIKSRIAEIKTYPESSKPTEYTIGSITLTKSSFDTGNDINNIVNDNIMIEWDNKLTDSFNQAVQEATDKINTGLGGYVTKTRDELLIMDNEEIEASKNLWRWNLGGLGFSSNGYSGPYELALTNDGKINASRILVGTLDGSLIRANSIQTNSLSVETVNKINSKIDSTDATNIVTTKLEAYDGTIKTHIQQTTDTAKTEAINSANNSTDEKLQNYPTLVDMQSAIEQTANSIKSEVSKTYSSKVDTETSINSAIDNLNIGGRNYLQDYMFKKDNIWKKNRSSEVEINTEEGYGALLASTANPWLYQVLSMDEFPPGQEVTVQYEIKCEGVAQNTGSDSMLIRTQLTGYETSTGGYVKDLCILGKHESEASDLSEWTKCTFTGTLTSDFGAANYVYFRLYARNFTGKIYFRNVMLEKGNKASDLVPAIEDTETLVDAVENSLKNEITTAIGGLQTQNNDLLNRFDEAFSDNVISAYEKVDLAAGLKQIDSQYETMGSVINEFNDPTLTANYKNLTTEWTKLHNFLDPILADMSTTSEASNATARSYIYNYQVQYNIVYVALNTYLKSSLSSLTTTVEQTADGVQTAIITSTSALDGVNTIGKHFNFTDSGWVEIFATVNGKEGRFKTQITDQKLSFLDNKVEVAYVSNEKLFINYAQVTQELQIGKVVQKKTEKGGLIFQWRG